MKPRTVFPKMPPCPQGMRRYEVDYHVDGRTAEPTVKGFCGTLRAAKNGAGKAILNGFCGKVAIIDRKKGLHVVTYRKTPTGSIREEV